MAYTAMAPRGSAMGKRRKASNSSYGRETACQEIPFCVCLSRPPRLAKDHVFDERTQLHEWREMAGFDKGAVGPQREDLGPLPEISGAGDDHDADVCSLGG